MTFYQQEMEKCPVCSNEGKVFADLNCIAFFEDKTQIMFKCESCNSKWNVVYVAQSVSHENLIYVSCEDSSMSTGFDLIAVERQRQIEVEGLTAEFDKQLIKEELVKAAVCYALPAKSRKYYGILHSMWPFERKWWKPSPGNRIKELVKAGALISAEIERLLALSTVEK